MTLDKSLSSRGLGFFICKKGFQVPILGPEDKLETRHNLKEDHQQKTEPALRRVWPCLQIQFLNSGEGPPPQDHLESMGLEPLPSPSPTTPFLLNPK